MKPDQEPAATPATGLELRSLVREEGELQLGLERVASGDPEPGEVVVRMEAAPINPTDIALLLGSADPAGAKVDGEGDDRRLRIPLSDGQMTALRPRVGLSLCPGLEGAGVVVRAGSGAEELLGRTVATFGGGMFAELRRISVADCIAMPDGTAPAKAGASHVNPLTALAMVETMRREGHRSFVLTAAASNLGQMLNRLCLADAIDVVNVVRRPEQAQMLRDLGVRFVCDSSAPDFEPRLTGMICATGATLGFDAIGGRMTSTLLRAMERAHAPERFSIYGSTTFKHVYVYGGLDRAPVQVARDVGLAWSVSGWLMMTRLAQLDAATVQQLKQRVVRDLDGIFASPFTGTIRLRDMLDPAKLGRIIHQATGEKHLLDPSG